MAIANGRCLAARTGVGVVLALLTVASPALGSPARAAVHVKKHRGHGHVPKSHAQRRGHSFKDAVSARRRRDTTPPTAPGSLAAAAGDTKVTLSWSASSDSYGVSGYRIYQVNSDGTLTQLGSTSSTLTFTAFGLTNGTTYSFRVKALDSAGNLSSASNTASATPQGSAPATTPAPAPAPAPSPSPSGNDVTPHPSWNGDFS